ncbi:transcriptional repressor LexA [Chiayiivirga flava]|uniref:LexA repressor n=1 Tax=Chiayiivirga flava TaxID=659595 RepID=A0A7W8G1X5_9GAMM|nr:repressor LexA [Chiayiivirga flava]
MSPASASAPRLTEIQRSILAWVAERIDAGMPPSQTEIMQAFGFKSLRAAQYHLEALERFGAIRRLPGKARGLQLVREAIRDDTVTGDLFEPDAAIGPDDAVRLPILGRVSAGQPIGADIGSDASLVLDRSVFSPSPDYLLKVQGDSMRDEGILDGDLIGVHRTRDARNGQIVVARIDDEITVKVLDLRNGGLRLLPRNPEHLPIDIDADQDFAIEGLYCGLVRPNR